MGLSSNARLLTITSRLTSNEYESQQVSNAKMRLALKSQSASEEYIQALNEQQLNFISFSTDGQTKDVRLTASLLYQYGDSKNQYVISNSAGQLLLSGLDAKNFKESKNLEDFLSKYDITRHYKTDILGEAAGRMKDNLTAYNNWQHVLEERMNNETEQTNWIKAKDTAGKTYLDALNNYNTLMNTLDSGISSNSNSTVKKVKQKTDSNGNTVNETDSNGNLVYETDSNGNFVYYTYAELKENYTDQMQKTRAKYEQCLTLKAYAETNAMATMNSYPHIKTAYEGTQKFQEARADYNAEIESLGIEYEEAYVYNDTAKAQWYTNLWYRLNGESSEKSNIGNSESNFTTLPSNLLSSDSWLRDSLSQGIVTIEKANYQNTANDIPDFEYPDVVNLRGITWESKIYSSCSDIAQSEDSQAKVLAEAEYKRKTNEINMKDEKYQRKLSLLDSEHNALQTEYESVKSAMDKNIDRSFKAFQG